MYREQMNIVIAGHVDHGKSTVIGRLLADTGSLPSGKLESVRERCRKSSKPFEYAFLLDALKDEQSQGITIDTARCFFKSALRDYIILDAPGHIEFLKNMVTGASRAEAALLVIDADEGIQENSKRHGHMVSVLGIKQVSILVNKMDLVDYSEDLFIDIKNEYGLFLEELNVEPVSFIPISAREGDNLVNISGQMPWYSGCSVLQQLDHFRKSVTKENLPFRMPVQDIYKFTADNDDRRIIAGTIDAGTISVGDEVILYPSRKTSIVRSIEGFNTPVKDQAAAQEATGFTLATQIYIKPGEMMVKKNEPLPKVGTRFKANFFWMGRAPMIKNKNYKLKIGAARTTVRLVDIISVIDASDLSSDKSKQQIDRHDVAESIFETLKPIVFDISGEMESTGRFVIVENYEISGGGIILDSDESEENMLSRHIKEREVFWEKGPISAVERALQYKHKSKFIVFTGEDENKKKEIAYALEKQLFGRNFKVYYLGTGNIRNGLDSDVSFWENDRDAFIRRLGELARIVTDSGQIFITTIQEADDYDLESLRLLNHPNKNIVVNVGDNNFNGFRVDLDLKEDIPEREALDKIYALLREEEIIPDFSI